MVYMVQKQNHFYLCVFSQCGQGNLVWHNGTARFKNLNICLNTNIYSYLETSVSQSLNHYLYVVHFFNTSVN
jgi:hypothetical protein